MHQQFPPRLFLKAYQGGTFFLKLMVTYTKQPTSIAEQIAMLKQRGLLIENDDYAFEKLNVISYFRLACYWHPLEENKFLHIFKPNSYFNDVIVIYEFDKELRNLLFSSIQSIEIAFRTRIIQFLSSEYGAFWFADSNVFKNKAIFADCLSNLQKEIKRSKEDFLTEHFAKYDNPPYPPAWKALEVSSFGTLSKLYCNLSDICLKKKVARSLGLPQHLYLESWMKSLSVLRNCIAHHSRIWNRKYPWKPQIPNRLPHLWIGVSSVKQEKLYAQLCCIAYLLDRILPSNTFKAKLKILIDNTPLIDIAAMGFPKDWAKEPLWR